MSEKDYLYDLEDIKRLLPHRYPFLLVDRIISIDQEKKKIIGIKNITSDEPFFPGHFPHKMVMPGVLIIEAMAQCGGILTLSQMEHPENMNVLFTNITNCHFHDKVTPGDQLRFELDLIKFKMSICKMKGSVYVEDKLVCTAVIAAAILPRYQ
jgi:UDP-3-O-[3-hydroxymyristoyl] N-acetylglucosamine deacetylase/3-hydroxyacyl-[acyl-carrier-protein] dehydratase